MWDTTAVVKFFPMNGLHSCSVVAQDTFSLWCSQQCCFVFFEILSLHALRIQEIKCSTWNRNRLQYLRIPYHLYSSMRFSRLCTKMANSEFVQTCVTAKYRNLEKRKQPPEIWQLIEVPREFWFFDSLTPDNLVSGIVVSDSSRITTCVCQHGFKKVFKSVLAELFESLNIERGTFFIDANDKCARIAHDSEWPDSALERTIFAWQYATGTRIKKRTIGYFVRIFRSEIEIKRGCAIRFLRKRNAHFVHSEDICGL